MLFTKPLSEVTFEDVQVFCETWPEGSRVEYKEKVEAKVISKVVSSFANTFGGVLIVGVKTDKTTNHAILPIDGIPFDQGIEERITQSCYANLYPPLLPGIRVLPIPNSDKMVVIVQVHESIEAPHAIENSTRAYIRTNSSTEQIGLAEIDRIDYLLKRRREGENRRRLMLDDLRMRSPFPVLKRGSILIKIGPQYPYRPILSRDDLTNRLKILPNIYLKNYHVPIRDGFMAPAPSVGLPATNDIYFAVNFHGMLVYELSLNKLPVRDEYQAVELDNILLGCRGGINAARAILEGYEGNLKIEVDLCEIGNCAVHYGTHASSPRYTPQASLDSYSRAELSLRTEKLYKLDETPGLLEDIIWQLMWPFGWHDRNAIEQTVNNLIR